MTTTLNYYTEGKTMRAFLVLVMLTFAVGTASATELAVERQRTSYDETGTKARPLPDRNDGGVKERESQLDLKPIVQPAEAAQCANVELASADLSGSGSAIYVDGFSHNTLLEMSHPIRHRRPNESGYGYRPSEYYGTIGVGAFDPSNQPGSGLYLNGGVGSVLADQLDLGLQLSWYHRSTGGEEFVREGDLPDGTHVRTVVNTQSVQTNLVPLLATLRVRIPASPGVEPYVGAGVGWEWLTVEGTDEFGVDFSNDYDGFGAQGIAGVNMEVGPRAALYGEAVWNASTPKAEFFDTAIGQTVREEVDFDGLAFHAGLRFRF